MTTRTVNVPNISCGHCVATVEREVGELEGVASVKAEQESKNVTISWDPETSDWTVIQGRLQEIGYPASE